MTAEDVEFRLVRTLTLRDSGIWHGCPTPRGLGVLGSFVPEVPNTSPFGSKFAFTPSDGRLEVGGG